MNNKRWDIVIRLIAQSVIKDNSQFWEALESLDKDTIETKDIVSKKELLLVIDVLKDYKGPNK